MGEDIADKIVDWKEGGKVVQRKLGDVLRKTFHLAINRVAFPQIAFFPSYGPDWFILPIEKDLKANMETLRNEFLVLINKRREDFKKPDF